MVRLLIWRAFSGSDWSRTYATGINDRGQIVGNGTYDGQYLAFLLTPGAVPEPSTWAMLLLGFAGLGFAGYRRARAGHATLAA